MLLLVRPRFLMRAFLARAFFRRELACALFRAELALAAAPEPAVAAEMAATSEVTTAAARKCVGDRIQRADRNGCDKRNDRTANHDCPLLAPQS
jgi:hypothetical protein